MTCLEEIRSSAERLVTAASDALRLEMAIFDSDSNLFYCTPTYLKKKGRTVHTPSIQEVLENGSILVTDPGNMPACIGCRFKEHCPSTIEILCCIHADTATAGVLSFTSFTREGQRRITENTSVYLNSSSITLAGAPSAPRIPPSRPPWSSAPSPCCLRIPMALFYNIISWLPIC